MEVELSSVTTARVSATGGAPHDTGRQPGAEPDQVPEEPHSLRRADGLHRETGEYCEQTGVWVAKNACMKQETSHSSSNEEKVSNNPSFPGFQDVSVV